MRAQPLHLNAVVAGCWAACKHIKRAVAQDRAHQVTAIGARARAVATRRSEEREPPGW